MSPIGIRPLKITDGSYYPCGTPTIACPYTKCEFGFTRHFKSWPLRTTQNSTTNMLKEPQIFRLIINEFLPHYDTMRGVGTGSIVRPQTHMVAGESNSCRYPGKRVRLWGFRLDEYWCIFMRIGEGFQEKFSSSPVSAVWSIAKTKNNITPTISNDIQRSVSSSKN